MLPATRLFIGCNAAVTRIYAVLKKRGINQFGQFTETEMAFRAQRKLSVKDQRKKDSVS
ncbi:MAG TPA: hypothetical protein VL728_06530 [Cyclobacteriaceae bacterium]|nr:hypothetical protein [Cyclobacteriaceae bacterium]